MKVELINMTDYANIYFEKSITPDAWAEKAQASGKQKIIWR